MSNNVTITKAVSFQMLSKFAIEGIAFISVPIFTRILSVTDYGLLAVYNAWLSLFTVFIGFQIQGTIPNAKIKYSENEFKNYLSSILSIAILIFIIFFIITFCFRVKLGSLFEIDSKLVPVLIINSFLSFEVSFFSTQLVQKKQFFADSLLSIIISVFTFGFSIFFVNLLNDSKYLGKIYGSILPLMICGITEILIVIIQGRTFFNKKYWQFCLKLSFPLLFYGASGILMAQSDKIMISKYFGTRETGVYSVVYTVVSVLTVIKLALNTAWVPFYYELKKNKKDDEVVKKTKNYLLFYTIITIGFTLCIPEVFRLLVPVEYSVGLNFLPVLILANFFSYLYSFPANFEFYNEKTKYIAFNTLISTTLNIILNIILIPRFQCYGAAIATAIAALFEILIHDFYCRFILKIDFEFKFYQYLLYTACLLVAIVIYYVFLNLFFVRWGIAICLGVYLLIHMIKNKTIF